MILERKHPTNVKELQSFLGAVNYYRRYIKGFADISAVLYNLLGDNVVWKWSDECNEAFEILKRKLASYPVLRQFDESKPLEVHCDASHFAVGCQLVQRDENGHEYAVENRSKKFNQHEINMSISEKEMAAVVYALKEFRGFLLGRSFKIITDHSALT